MKSWFHSILSIVAIALLATSCSTDKDINEGEGNLQINLKGIEEYVDADKIGKLASANGLPKDGPVEIQSLNGFDVIANVEVQEPIADKSNDKIASISAPKNINKVATAVPLGSTVKYALAFYDESDNLVEGSPYEITGTTQPTIQLPLGQYKWVAYSINSTDLPTLTNGILAATDIANKDFIYASGNTTIETGFNYLELTFKRMTTQFEITLNARGMFGKIGADTKVKLKYGDNNEYLKTNIASFDVLSGTYGTPSQNSVDLESSSWEEVSHNGAVKKISFFVLSDQLSQISENSLKLEFAPLKVDYGNFNFVIGYEKKEVDGQSVDDLDKPINQVREFTREFENSTVVLVHPEFNSINGYRYKIEASIVESAIQLPNNTTKWARSNIWYDEGSDDKYRFRVSPHFRDMPTGSAGGYLQDVNDLWRFNTETPGASSQTNGFDPCTRVYPTNLWKMASANDFTSLPLPDEVGVIDRGEPLVWILASFKPYEMIATWKNTPSTTSKGYSTLFRPVDSRSSSNDLHLPGIGFKNVLGTILERPTASAVLDLGIVELIPTISGGGHYWTSEAIRTNNTVSRPTYFDFAVNSGGLLTVGVPSVLELKLLDITGKFNKKTGNSMLAGSLSAGYDNWEARMSIRCVRNNNFPGAPIYN